MNTEIPRFNYIAMNGLDGKLEAFPILINHESHTEGEGKALLEAARIVHANVHQMDGGIEGLIDTVGEILTDPKSNEGLIIEDELGGGSVTVNSKDTEVVANYVENGEWTVGTDSFFEMLGALKNSQ